MGKPFQSIKLTIPTLEVREASGDAQRWLRTRVVNEAELMYFRWSTTRTDLGAATYRVRRSSISGTEVFAGHAGDAPAPGHYRGYQVNFKRIMPATPPNTPREYWVQLDIGMEGGGTLTSSAVRIVYQANTSEPTNFTSGGLGEPIYPLVEGVRTKYGLPALGAVAMRNNGTLQVSARGIRRHGHARSVTETDRWHLGSDTKAMTATLAAILVDRGLIGWTSTASEVFPEFRDEMSPAFRTCTLVDLLRHRSGLGGGLYSSTDSDILRREGETNPVRRYNFTKAHLANTPLHPPGRWVYSNHGYIVAAAMMERRGGQSWEEMMKKLLFQPLRMHRTGFGAPEAAIQDIGPKQPWGHRGWGSGRQSSSADTPSASGPAGNVHASLRDWARFLMLHLNGHEGKLDISTSSMSQLHTPEVDHDPASPGTIKRAYACGWGAGFNDKGLDGTYSHSGCNTWWYARAVMDIGKGYGVLVTTNIADAECDDMQVLSAVAELTNELKEYLGV